LDVRKVDTLKNGNEAYGNRTRIKVVKNKVAPPFKSAEFDIIYGEGISKEGSILDMAVARKIVQKTGAWYSYGDLRIGQGRDNARTFLKDNKELCAEIEAKIRAEIANIQLSQGAENDADELPED
jgi:recombination protein RecA